MCVRFNSKTAGQILKKFGVNIIPWRLLKSGIFDVEYEVLWVVMPYRSERVRRFGGTFRPSSSHSPSKSSKIPIEAVCFPWFLASLTSQP
jgi:hypothetical protein